MKHFENSGPLKNLAVLENRGTKDGAHNSTD